MPSQTLYKIDVLEISSKFIGTHALPDSLDSGTDNYQIIFLKNQENLFYRTSLNDCFWYQFNLLTVLRRFSFRTDHYLFKIPSYFRVYQNSSPSPPGLYIFFTLNKHYWGKNYTRIKRVDDIYLIKYVSYFHKTPQGPEYVRVLNIPES